MSQCFSMCLPVSLSTIFYPIRSVDLKARQQLNAELAMRWCEGTLTLTLTLTLILTLTLTLTPNPNPNPKLTKPTNPTLTLALTLTLILTLILTLTLNLKP